jgi:hypothetical protein
MAWMLEEIGYHTFLQAWDFQAASNFVLQMQSGVEKAPRTIAVLTPSYFESAFTKPEWAAALASDPCSQGSFLIRRDHELADAIEASRTW